MRTIVQIAGAETVMALCDDGTIWVYFESDWRQCPPLPQPSAAEPFSWQPGETAPRDGTEFLVTTLGTVGIYRWDADNFYNQSDEPLSRDPDQQPNFLWCSIPLP